MKEKRQQEGTHEAENDDLEKGPKNHDTIDDETNFLAHLRSGRGNSNISDANRDEDGDRWLEESELT